MTILTLLKGTDYIGSLDEALAAFDDRNKPTLRTGTAENEAAWRRYYRDRVAFETLHDHLSTEAMINRGQSNEAITEALGVNTEWVESIRDEIAYHQHEAEYVAFRAEEAQAHHELLERVSAESSDMERDREFDAIYGADVHEFDALFGGVADTADCGV